MSTLPEGEEPKGGGALLLLRMGSNQDGGVCIPAMMNEEPQSPGQQLSPPQEVQQQPQPSKQRKQLKQMERESSHRQSHSSEGRTSSGKTGQKRLRQSTSARWEPSCERQPPPPEAKKCSAKNKNRECALCKIGLPTSYAKNLCSDCIQKTIAEESPRFSLELKDLIQTEVRESLRGLTSRKKKKRKLVSSESEESVESRFTRELPSSSNHSSSSSESSDDNGGGRPCFSVDNTERLVKAVRGTMGITDTKVPRTVQDVMFGGLDQRRRCSFPVNDRIKSLIEREWKKPERKGQLPSSSKRRYPFEDEDAAKWDKTPKIDVAISKSSKKSTLPFEDLGALKDPLDKKAESFLKQTWESSAGALKPAVAATCTARSMMIWLQQLEDQIRGNVSREKILSDLPLVQGAAAFLADASADSVRLAARSANLSNAARRALWLKSWPGDVQSKSKLCSIPCEGDFLFGKGLDDILDKAADKKHGFPTVSGSRFNSSFRKRKYSRSKAPRDQGSWKDRKPYSRGFMFGGPSSENKKAPK
ncbi:uncharacterized protein [Phyllobates terribilis]|uniref:uncharacterized protein n=1 Tax=Phyllobates terribilis TaxID=111132 RepID=UPI003CCA8ED4